MGQEDKAKKLLKRTKSNVQALVDAGETEESLPLTVERYGRKWVAKRVNTTVKDDEGRLNLHVFSKPIGKMLLTEVRPRHVREWVRAMVAEGNLAPRSVRTIYGVFHTMMHDAQVDELTDGNPCALKRGDLPKKVDKDPTWRAGAVFTRDEVERLIADDRVPEDRRMISALLGIAGLRFGEAAALRWSHYDAGLEPLGRLLVAASYNVDLKAEKSVKTERPREVPVHPALAAVLAEWKLGGWERLMGRAPKPTDLIVPSRLGANRSVNHALKKFHQDCDRLGIRRRRQHDLRRTFISLARADGARKDILEFVTHGPRGDIVDLYTTLPWAALCEEVAKLKVTLREGEGAKVIPLPVVQASGAGEVLDGKPPEPRYSPRYSAKNATAQTKQKARHPSGYRAFPFRGVDGTRMRPGREFERTGAHPRSRFRALGRTRGV